MSTDGLADLLTFTFTQPPTPRSRTTPRPRDSRRQAIYRAQDSIDHGREFTSIEEVQAYIDSVTSARWFRSRWGSMRVPVICRTAGGSTGQYQGRINLSRVAGHWNEVIALHELAHVLESKPGRVAHDSVWVACFLLLVRQVMGDDAWKALRQALVERNVPVQKGVSSLPKPGTRKVVTKAARVARERAVTTRPVTEQEREAAAAIIRRAASQGLLGAADRKPRQHALATARLLSPTKWVG